MYYEPLYFLRVIRECPVFITKTGRRIMESTRKREKFNSVEGRPPLPYAERTEMKMCRGLTQCIKIKVSDKVQYWKVFIDLDGTTLWIGGPLNANSIRNTAPFIMSAINIIFPWAHVGHSIFSALTRPTAHIWNE